MNDNILPFKRPGAAGASLSTLKTANVQEEAIRRLLADSARTTLSGARALAYADRLRLSENLRQIVYGLKNSHGLDPRDIALRVFHRSEVRALQRYVAPIRGAEHRNLSGCGRRYLAIATAAANLAGTNENECILQLVADTSFMPGMSQASDMERRAAIEICGLFQRLSQRLERVYPLNRFFGALENSPISITVVDGVASLFDEGKIPGYDYLAIPKTLIAKRPVGEWVELLIRIDPDPEPNLQSWRDQPGDDDQVMMGLGRIQESLFIGIYCPPGKTQESYPVAILERAVQITLTDEGWTVDDSGGWDRLDARWHQFTVRNPAGLKLAAMWKPAGPQTVEGKPAYAGSPNVRIVRLEPDFVLNPDAGTEGVQCSGGWVLSSENRKWISESELSGVSRFLDDRPMARAIELLINSSTDNLGIFLEIEQEYRTLSRALQLWLDAKHDLISNKFEWIGRALSAPDDEG